MSYRKDSAFRISTEPFTVTAAFSCDACRHLVSATAETRTPEYSDYFDKPERLWTRLSAELPNADWEPKRVVGKMILDIPPHIASPADEAYKCHSIGADRAAILLARSVIEASAKESGVTKGSLAAKIDKLAEEGHVRKLIASAAHEIRHVGNEMAHGDFATADITSIDAQDTLDFMEDFLRELFEIPTRVAKRRAKREGGLEDGAVIDDSLQAIS